ncbi:hypothetical protein [Mycolicibacterium tusciae]|uniref:Uncharacterized protein n=1 Tax=Mycolicibacterium tusciae TaxID=75922 RepID=A0A1X0JLV9_9MYCO|nr:hypothetical protein [Mycolicibacterium tusciae]ORB63873.1 hypothetical protein BST47_17705 [Mycolicibacterium tusciae]
MQQFTITWGRYWFSRIAGRNPLVRGDDRIQAWLILLAALVTVLVLPVAAAIGTAVYDARSRSYAEEAKHRPAVTATALENSTVEVGPGPADVSFFVRASWTAAGGDHIDVVKWADEATVGDQAEIWVDDFTGEPVDAPAKPSRAVGDAVGVALSVWFAVMAIAASTAYLTRLRIIHRRGIQWDRELEALKYQS